MNQLISSAAGAFLALFPIANPLGAVPTFYSLTTGSTPARRIHQARQVAIKVVTVLTAALVVGRFILDFFGISDGGLQIAGGVLLVQTAWAMITIRQSLALPDADQGLAQEDITLIPMAIPLISGPGAVGMVIGLTAKSSELISYAGAWLGILGLGLLLYLCLALGEPLIKLLGKSGLKAFTQVLGFFILAIAVQMISEGTFSLVNEFTSRLA